VMNTKNIAITTCLYGTLTSLVHAQEKPNTETLWAMTIEQRLKVQITSATHFSESMLTNPSSVSVIHSKVALLDDIPINSFVYGTDVISLDNLELATLQQMEVVRGPSSTLYGSDALHSSEAYQAWRLGVAEPQSKLNTDESDYSHSSLQSFQTLGENWILGLALAASKEGNQDSDQRTLNWDSQTAIIHLIQHTLGDD